MLKPCQNNGSCTNDNSTLYGYVCSCLTGFNGTECQYDYRPCKQNTCWNNGINILFNFFERKSNDKINLFIIGMCNETSSTAFTCSCASGWQNIHCQTKINYCKNISCLNKGVCLSLLLNYTCECIDNSYSGRYCETIGNSLVVHQTVARSFAFIAISVTLSVALFIVIMDVLKYCFGIDPVDSIRQEGRYRRRRKHVKKHKPAAIIRFLYVNAPPQQSSVKTVSTIQETSVHRY
jgi:hypothetical protein